MKSFKIFLITFLAVTSVIISSANANKLNKNFKQEFSISKGDILLIDNRYGQVRVENWDENTVSIEVEVTVDHSRKDRAEKMLSAIDITLEKSNNEIRGITRIDDKLMKSIGNLNFSSSSKELSIDYIIKMPKDLDVNLKNKYGDIFIDVLSGHAVIDLKYGNLKANKIMYGSHNPLSLLTLGYGNASIDEVDWLKLDVKYTNVDIVKGKALVILSKYSKISVDEVSSIVTESKYDTFTLGRISNIVGESGYTTYRIRNLSKKLNIQSKYGDVRVEAVDNNFESITFTGSYASVYAPIASSVSYQFDGEASYGGLSYNTPARVNRIESNNKVIVNGRVGENDNAKAAVKVRVRYGSAKLK